MYIEGYTTSIKILADLVKTLCMSNTEHPEHQWKLEYPIGDIENNEIYNWIIQNRFAIISTEYPIEFITDSKHIKVHDIEIDNDYLIINLLNYPKAFTQLYYKNMPIYRNESKEDLALLEYYVNNDRIYLLKQNLDIDSFKITYGKPINQTTKFYVKFEYPRNFVSNTVDSELHYSKKTAENKYFIKWNYGKYIDKNFNVFSDEIFKIPSKDFFCFWRNLNNFDIRGQWIDDILPEYFLLYHITYDNKSMSFIIQNETTNSDNDIRGFNYIGALENCKDTVTNEIDNFGSCGNVLLNQNEIWELYSEEWIETEVTDFTYTGSAQEFILRPGMYRIECWGAAGGSYNNTPGLGGYTKGVIHVKNSTSVFIYVGGQGISTGTNQLGGWNGGGQNITGGANTGGSGGGSSDIRLINGSWDDITSLRSRIIVAGAGGGGGFSSTCGNAGGINGTTGVITAPASHRANGTGGTQITGGSLTNSWTVNSNSTTPTPGSFGKGGRGTGNSDYGGGGGSGYYGGGGAVDCSGGGGSSFISGHLGCNAIRDENSTVHTGQSNHYSGLVFTETIMKSGNESMPNKTGIGNVIGNNGNGHIKITRFDKFYEFNVMPKEVNNFGESNFIFYRTPAGGFYQEHKVAAYSTWEMDINKYKKLSFTSSYTNETVLSKIQLVHPYEMARGYLRRVLTTPSIGEYKIPIEVNYNGNDEDFIYLRRSQTKDIFKNSNILFNTILFQVTN